MALFRQKPWATGMRLLPTVEFLGDHVRINDLRNFRYNCNGAPIPKHETRVYDLGEIQSVDFIIVPFSYSDNLAHTMMSFGFENGQHVCVSIEARRREGQEYSIFYGLFNVYPLFYVIADERDAIGERIECRKDDVYLYRCTASPGLARSLFVDVLKRANRLAERTERYNIIWRNCTTGIRNHVNRVWPGHIPWSWRVLFTGHVDYLAYQLRLFQSDETFESTKRQAYISDLVKECFDDEDFSRNIRRGRD